MVFTGGLLEALHLLVGCISHHFVLERLGTGLLHGVFSELDSSSSGGRLHVCYGSCSVKGMAREKFAFSLSCGEDGWPLRVTAVCCFRENGRKW